LTHGVGTATNSRLPVRKLYDLPQGTGALCGLCSREIPKDVLSGDDAGKIAQVIHHGNKILVHGTVYKFFHTDGDGNGGIIVVPQDIPHPQLLQILHGTGKGVILPLIQEAPEKVALADGADIMAAPGDDRSGCVSMVPHLFQPLAEGAVIIQIGDTVLGEQKISNVHFNASFLGAWHARIWLFQPSGNSIQKVQEKLMNNL